MIVYKKLLINDLKNNSNIIFYKSNSIVYTITKKNNLFNMTVNKNDIKKKQYKKLKIEDAHRIANSIELTYKKPVKDYKGVK